MSDLPLLLRQLGDLSRELDTAVAKLGELDEIRIHAEADYKSAEARAFKGADGPVETRKRDALLACDAQWRTWALAESAVSLQKAHLKALHARVDVGRSIFSARKAEVGIAQMGDTP